MIPSRSGAKSVLGKSSIPCYARKQIKQHEILGFCQKTRKEERLRGSHWPFLGVPGVSKDGAIWALNQIITSIN